MDAQFQQVDFGPLKQFLENDFEKSYNNQFMFSKNQIKYYIDEYTIDCLNELTNLIFGHNYLRD